MRNVSNFNSDISTNKMYDNTEHSKCDCALPCCVNIYLIFTITEITSKKYIFIQQMEDKNPTDMKQETPMHIAAENGYHEVIEIFLEILTDKNPPNANGWTPLHFAANKGHSECVRVILEEPEV